MNTLSEITSWMIFYCDRSSTRSRCAVGRHLQQVFKQGNAPAGIGAPPSTTGWMRGFQVGVPGKVMNTLEQIKRATE